MSEIILPGFAGPRSGFRRIFRRIAVMPRSEALAPFRIVLLNLHIGITEANLDHRALRIADVHRFLLGLARCVEWFAKRYFLSLVLGHIKIGIAVNLATP